MEIERPFTTAEWLHTPEAVRLYIEILEKSISQLSGSVTDLTGSIMQLKERTEKLEQQVGRNSQNSNQPPSLNALCASAYCGANAVLAAKAIKVFAGWSVFCPSKKPVASRQRHRFACW
jgi:hypothetical protein